MPKRRMSTKTSRQKAAAKVNLAKARKAAANARSANANGATKAAGYGLKKASLFRAKAAGAKPRGKTVEPKAHTREKPKKPTVTAAQFRAHGEKTKARRQARQMSPSAGHSYKKTTNDRLKRRAIARRRRTA